MHGRARGATRRELLYALAGVTAGAAGAAAIWRARDQSPARLRAALLENPDLLVDNPDLVARANEELRARASASDVAARAELLSTKWRSLVSGSPAIGSRNASRLLIEFTDYTCAPCHVVADHVRALLSARPDVRLAVMLLPTGGPLSEFAARTALAAHAQSPQLFASLHEKLMAARGALTQDHILRLAAAAGANVDQLGSDISGSEVRQHLGAVKALAADLGISGVPAFAIEGRLLLGGASAEKLRALLGEPPAVEVRA